MTALPPLAIEKLEVHFGGLRAVQGVDLELGVDQIVALVGANGAGKTTVLNAIAGVTRYTSARFELFGRPVPQTPWARASAGITRSFQHPHFIENESVLTNLLCGAHVGLSYSPWDQVLRPWVVRKRESAFVERAEELLARVGLESTKQERISSLPYGPRKLIDILRALMTDARVVLLDEPSSGLDASERRVVLGLLHSIRLAGVSALVVEHHADLVRAAADQVIALEAGRVIARGRPERVYDDTAAGQAARPDIAGGIR